MLQYNYTTVQPLYNHYTTIVQQPLNRIKEKLQFKWIIYSYLQLPIQRIHIIKPLIL